MTKLPFRTHVSDLLDAELVLLDVLFNRDCRFRILRDGVFRAQWNFPFSHGLSDDELRASLRSMCQRGILAIRRETATTWFHTTKRGFDAWSDERCPKWDRFCTWHTRDSSRGRTRLTVVAVSSDIRDDFIRYWPQGPARRKTATIADYGLVPFHSHGILQVGLATFLEPQPSTCSDLNGYTDDYRRYLATISENRSWWGSVPQLQRFLLETA